MKLIDLVGRRFGRLVVRERHLPQANPRLPEWLCDCDCGTQTIVVGSRLRTGHTKSCGCWRIIARYKHGHTRRDHARCPEYTAWTSMWQRTTNPRNPEYRNYGARGIGVCARWRTFENFLADMEPRPSPKHSLDRRDNSKGYTPGNCRWATSQEQLRNTRYNRWIEYGGERQILTEWAARLGISEQSLSKRLRRWPIDRVFAHHGRSPIHVRRSAAS